MSFCALLTSFDHYVSLILNSLRPMLGQFFGTNVFNTAFWSCVGVMLGRVGLIRGPFAAMLGAMLGHTEVKFRLILGHLELYWADVGPRMGYVRLILGHLEPYWGYIRLIFCHLEPSWAHVGPRRSYVRLILGHLELFLAWEVWLTSSSCCQSWFQSDSTNIYIYMLIYWYLLWILSMIRLVKPL
jgi:hypothetical protein